MAVFEARKEIKLDIQREGRMKLCRVPARDITAMAKAGLFEEAEHRERLIAEAKRVVEQWRVEGYFGKAVRHSQDLHDARSAEPPQNPERMWDSEVPASPALVSHADNAMKEVSFIWTTYTALCSQPTR
jgi:hypothetical protein